MIMILLMLFFALALSGAAAYYSIIGLMAIFAASPIPIAVMGSLLEGSKLVVASWLYRNWTDVPRLMKGYLVTALVVLMFLTSMGIFGFLSKAHLDQAVPTGDIAAKVALLDEKIKTEKENINAARQTLNQLDQQVNQTISRTTDAAGTDRSIAIRRGQTKERAALQRDIEQSQAAIAKLNEERSPIAGELRKVEAEVGPVKYIAALIYGDEAAQETSILEKAVRWVTILIVAVFDPLAVIMLIAANWSLSRYRREVPPAPVEENKPTESKFDWTNHSYLQKPFVHFKNLKPIVAQTDEPPKPNPIVEKIKRVRSKIKREEPTPPPEVEATPDPVSRSVANQEHPAFESEGEVWGARPRTHLTPHDPRKG